MISKQQLKSQSKSIVITEPSIMFIHNSQYEKPKESFQERQMANEQQINI